MAMRTWHNEPMLPVDRRDQSEKLEVPSAEDDINVPWVYRWVPINHYYGDTVRQLLIAAAALMLLAAPFYTDNISVELPFIVLGTVVLVAVSAMTSPKKSSMMSADVVVSGVGLVIFEIWAIGGYGIDEFHKFILREALALVFLFALYYSTKTLRSMLMRETGRRDKQPEEQVSLSAGDKEGNVDLTKVTKEELREINEHEKTEFSD